MKCDPFSSTALGLRQRVGQSRIMFVRNICLRSIRSSSWREWQRNCWLQGFSVFRAMWIINLGAMIANQNGTFDSEETESGPIKLSGIQVRFIRGRRNPRCCQLVWATFRGALASIWDNANILDNRYQGYLIGWLYGREIYFGTLRVFTTVSKKEPETAVMTAMR